MASMTLREAGQLYIIVLLQYFDIQKHEILAHLNEKDAMLIIMTMLRAAKNGIVCDEHNLVTPYLLKLRTTN